MPLLFCTIAHDCTIPTDPGTKYKGKFAMRLGEMHGLLVIATTYLCSPFPIHRRRMTGSVRRAGGLRS